MSFKLNVSDFENLTVETVVALINSSYKKPLGELLLYDLLINETRNEALRHGTYLFFNDKNECLYVGMCSSSHFAHRIGGHFGMSPKYGMNTFLKRIVKELGLKDRNYEGYVEALPQIATYSILIINANNKGKAYISQLEKLLHIAYKLKLNFPAGFPSTYKAFDLSGEFTSVVKLM